MLLRSMHSNRTITLLMGQREYAIGARLVGTLPTYGFYV
jgi:hypothetical protein